MSKNTLKNINNIPDRTWEWLGVNNTSLNNDLPEFKKYDHHVINNYSGNDYIIQAMDKSHLSAADNNDYEGINKDSLMQAKNDFNTGALIQTFSDKRIAEPVFIDYVFDDKNPTVIDNNIITAEENSEITVVIRYKGFNGNECFHNGLTRIYAKSGSVVNIVKIQELSDDSIHLDSNFAVIEDNATVNYTEVILGSLNSVTNYRSDIMGFRGHDNIYSIYLGDKNRKVDINYLVNHYGKDSRSNITVRGALLDRSDKIFRGTIDFKKGCPKSKGAEEEYCILLSPDVRNRSVPILLCTEEDVDGQHAASSGRIDENKLFYLMTRGLNETEAKRAIIQASFNPIIDKIPMVDIKNEISDCIRRKLANG